MLPAKLHHSLIFLISILTTHSLSQPVPSTPILYDIYPFIRVYKNGTVQRFIGQDFAPPSPAHPTAGVLSKDVKFSPEHNLSARIYLPARRSQKLPLLIYFHGGGFFTESAFSPTYHNHLNSLVARANVVAVSVNYRLAPENPLPAAHHDSWEAVKWTFSHAGGNGSEPWLAEFADFRRVYLGGDSAGANIAHNMAIRIGSENSDPGSNRGIRVIGMFLNCPYFLGKTPVGNESDPDNAFGKKLIETVWIHAYPNSSSGLDNPLANPGMDPGLKSMGVERVLVFVAGNDFLRFRGWYYERELEESGWRGEVKVAEFAGENHVFDLSKPKSRNAVLMHRMMAEFMNR